MDSTVNTATDMNVLLRPDRRDALVAEIRSALASDGAENVEITLRGIDSACEPDNMLIAEYQQRFETPPISEQVHRLTVEARWPGGVTTTSDVTARIAGCLPPGPNGTAGLWFGQTSALRSSE